MLLKGCLGIHVNNYIVIYYIPALCSKKLQIVTIGKIQVQSNNSRIMLLASFPIPYYYTSRTTFNDVTVNAETYTSIRLL